MPAAPLRFPRRLTLSAAAVVATTASMLSVATLAAPAAHAATGFTPDDVVVYRVGTGAAALTNAATASFLDEFSPTGAAVQSIALPTATSGSNKILTSSGTASSEGLLSLSPNGRFLTTAGYSALPGTQFNGGSIGGSSSASVPRTVAIAGTDGSVDTSTSLTDFASANNPRNAVTIDGTAVWAVGGAGGVRYAVKGATTSTQITDPAATSNFRNVVVAGGQLYVTSQSGSTRVASVGTGTPTTGPQALTLLPGAISNAGPTPTPNNNPYQISFATLGSGTAPDTAYVADNSAGVMKFSLANGTWNLTGTISLAGVTGVAANIYNGAVRIYATTPTGLFRITDSSGAGGTLSGSAGAAVATPAANTAFRGVAYAPGTTITTGGTTPPAVGAPTVTVANPAIGTSLGDADTNPSTTTATVGVGANGTYAAGNITVTASSSNAAVLPNANIAVSGTGPTRTITLSPGGTAGTATVTITATAPDAQTSTATIAYDVSANLGDPTDRYFYGASNASAAIDAGGGYLLVGDDEDNAIKLYDTAHSGAPVKNFDFSGQLPFGTKEVDTEAAARIGNTIYWLGSMSNNSSGVVSPARSTLFATTISGSGATTTLTWAGANQNLQTDLVNWDKNNGHGLGANYFGFDQSVNGGIANHQIDSFNVEGLEIAPDGSTGWISFRAPISPAANRTKALIVPVTNFAALVGANPTAVHGTFGAPIQLDLGGLGIRDIRQTATGQYLILAGTADSTNTPFTLYTWDGVAADAPLKGQDLPALPGGAAGNGSWETIGALPSTLTAGAGIEFLQDDGDVAWYLDGQTSKTGQAPAVQKSLGRTIVYTAPAPAPTTTTIGVSNSSVTAGDQVVFTATVTGGSGALTGGTVAFADGGGTISGCDARPVGSDGTATCTTSYAQSGTYHVTATYSGTATSATSTSTAVSVDVAPVVVTTATTLGVSDTTPAIGEQVTYTATVTASGPLTGTVAFTQGGTALSGCASVPVGADGTATCAITYAHVGSHEVVAAYSGSTSSGASSSDPVTVTVQPTAVTVTADDATITFGQSDPTFTATASPAVTFVTAPTCTVAGPHTAVGSYAITCSGADAGPDYTITYADGTLSVLLAVTDVVLTTDPAAPVTGQPFDLVATVTTPGLTGFVPTGTVGFTVDGSDVSGCSAVAVDTDGVARCAVDAGLVAGSHAAIATYSGDGSFSSDASPADVEVATAATTTTVAADNDALVATQAVTFTATVAVSAPGAPSPDAPTGTVGFLDGSGTALTGCAAVALGTDGTAQCVVGGGFAPSSVAVHAVYSGDTGFATSTSDAVTIPVTKAASSVDVAASTDTPVTGQSVTYTATVSAVAPAAGTPTGTATFTVSRANGATVACRGGNAVTLSAGRAVCVVPAGKLVAGIAYSIAVSYSGDSNFAAATGSRAQTVSKAATQIALTTSPAKATTGVLVTIKAQLTAVAPATGHPFGTLTFDVRTAGNVRVACADGNTVDVAASPQCVIPSGVLAASAGPYSVSVKFSGSAKYTGSTASAAIAVGKATSAAVATQSSASTAQGRPVTFGIVVTPRREGPSPLGGTVTFSVKDRTGATVACSGGGALAPNGTQYCTVPGASLVAANGPYTATATWTGDGDFSGSSATVTHTVVAR